MALKPEVRAELRITLESLWEAYADGNLEAIMAHYAPEADLVVIGSGGDERYLGPDELRAGLARDLAQSQARQVATTWFKADGLGGVAWAAIQCEVRVTAGGQQMTLPGRGTFVLTQQGTRWLIVQSHFSLPLAGQQAGQSFPQA
jgi:ketosteroid isomerase-like protein